MQSRLSDVSNPVTNPDVQEALSRVQGNKTILVLPLTSGKFAIFGRDFQLYEIWDHAPDAEALRALSARLHSRLSHRRKRG